MMHMHHYPPDGRAPISPDEVDAITVAIKTRRYPWCRSRLLAALAAAEEQEILGDVLDELLGADGERVGEKMRDSLHRNGWMV